MGCADIVPGVSGGTVALVLGIYKTLISNVRQGARALKLLVTGQIGAGFDALKEIDWLFIIPLGAGVVGAFAVLRHPMQDLLVEHSEGTAAVFSGLVVASCVLVAREIKTWDAERIVAAGGVAAAAFYLLGFQAGAVADPPLIMFLVTGSVAICAMILPGISGSFIMLMLGMYAAVLGGSIVELGTFLVGAVIGLALFSSLLSYLLANYEQTVLAALLGLMLGSFRVLWPWPNGVGFISDEASEVVVGTGLEMPELGELAGGLALGAIAVVATLAIVKVAEAPQTDM
jgi:putative membrane protein